MFPVSVPQPAVFSSRTPPFYYYYYFLVPCCSFFSYTFSPFDHKHLAKGVSGLFSFVVEHCFSFVRVMISLESEAASRVNSVAYEIIEKRKKREDASPLDCLVT